MLGRGSIPVALPIHVGHLHVDSCVDSKGKPIHVCGGEHQGGGETENMTHLTSVFPLKVRDGKRETERETLATV